MPTYSDSEMRAIIGRALQIDSGRSERFTPEQLRAIAAELGISTQALEVAMYEADSGERGLNIQSRTSPAPKAWGKGFAIAIGVLVVVALGLGVMSVRLPVRPYAGPAPTRTTKTAPARAIKKVPPTTEQVVPVEPGTTTATKKTAPPQ
jgi:hypothetical protein